MKPNSTIPIIRLEVEGMKHAVLHAFSDHLLTMDEDIKAAVDKIVTPEYIQRIVENAAAEYMKVAIEEEIRNFYLYGDGRKAVKEACAKLIDNY